VRKAISDTGPILHLHEIGRERALGVFERLVIPDLVAGELQRYAVDVTQLDIPDLIFSVVPVATEEWEAVMYGPEAPAIQPADVQVFVLAQANQLQHPVLTDDLALRQYLESHHGVVVGSVGVLVRAYRVGLFQRNELDEAIDSLFDYSTLHLSHAFRAYVRRLLTNLP